ncbi:hypothetical protein FRB96_008654 [Tulasnella sp. 330]|nr:hypothetical protein FRB96_008654 [Tulasnella sp. 330]KAG8872585.1 hypothetical protein FRB97_007494 [Tulasnella sp. 331]KAG8875941.1 hypothetical protein FRB98_007521 [Tulasnella sp. 332]
MSHVQTPENPLSTSGLGPEEPEGDRIGSRSDFWNKYEEFAKEYDKDMMEGLNTNLDVLLIFAGLFSAVNTAFIVVAMAALSANPADETNHLLRLLVMNVSNHTLTETDLTPIFVVGRGAVRQNCTFFASLCCSLLAAIGAVLAKQCLQSYARTGQTGPTELRAIRRTEKFVGVRTWGLRPAVEALATLLLVSLALFFVALADYMWTVEETVALVIMAFAIAGGILYALMVVFAAFFPACPFQTAPSAALRWPYLILQRLIHSLPESKEWLRVLHSNRSFMAVADWLVSREDDSLWWGVATYSFILLMGLFTAPILYVIFGCVIPLLQRWTPPKREKSDTDTDLLYARSMTWMAESAPHIDSMLAIAENVPLISEFDAVRIIITSTTPESLISQLQKSLLTLQRGRSSISPVDTVILARAVSYVVLADPKHTASMVQRLFLNWEAHPAKPGTRVKRLIGCTSPLTLRPASTWGATRAAIFHTAQENSSATIWLRHCIITATYNQWDEEHMERLIQDIADVFLLEGVEVDAACLSRAMDAILAILEWYPIWGYRHGHPTLNDGANLKLVWSLVLGALPVVDQLPKVLDAFSNHYATQDPSTFPTFLRCQMRLLHHINKLRLKYDDVPQKALPSSPNTSRLERMHSSLNSNLTHTLLEPSDKPPSYVKTCERELITALRCVLLTSSQRQAAASTDLVETGRLALRVSGVLEKEQVLQGILYGLPFTLGGDEPGLELDIKRRLDSLNQAQDVALLLASGLGRCLWLCPSITANEAWSAFEALLRAIAIGCHDAQGQVQPLVEILPQAPSIAPVATVNNTSVDTPVDVPVVWATAFDVARSTILLEDNCLGFGIMWLALKEERRCEMLEKMDIGRLTEWFAQFMLGLRREDEDASVPKETQGHSAAEKKCVGLLFLQAWSATLMDAGAIGTYTHKSLEWTSSDTLRGFACWLYVYDNQETVEIKLKDVVLLKVSILEVP